MKFQIIRVSSEDEQPCSEAYSGIVVKIEEREALNPTKIPNQSEWFSKGKNHRIEGIQAKRDVDSKGWLIDVNSIEELMELVSKYDSLIIESARSDRYLPIIRIWDDYIE